MSTGVKLELGRPRAAMVAMSPTMNGLGLTIIVARLDAEAASGAS